MSDISSEDMESQEYDSLLAGFQLVLLRIESLITKVDFGIDLIEDMKKILDARITKNSTDDQSVLHVIQILLAQLLWMKRSLRVNPEEAPQVESLRNYFVTKLLSLLNIGNYELEKRSVFVLHKDILTLRAEPFSSINLNHIDTNAPQLIKQ